MPVNAAELKFFQTIAEAQSSLPARPLQEKTLAEFRKESLIFVQYTGPAAEIPIENTTIPARDGYAIPIRIYNAHLKNAPVLIFYPGCGYVSDLFEVNAISCSRIAKFSGVKVIIVNYRLAPEHPIPGSIEDAYDATKWIMSHPQQYHLDPTNICLGGLSSGAHCAAVISQQSRVDTAFKIKHQILLNGLYDLTLTPKKYKNLEQEDKLCTPEVLEYIFSQYKLTQDDLVNPLHSPYFQTNFEKLPPATVIIGEYDALRSNSEAYYEKLLVNNVSVNKIILPGQTHNTILLRGAMSDDPDPAQIIADELKLVYKL